MFDYENTIVAALNAAAIPGLQVETTADVSDAKFKALTKPTAIVALGEEALVQANRDAANAEVFILVYLVLRGATRDRTEADTFFREEVFQALHGAQLEGLHSPLEWRSTVSDYVDNARTYLLTFAAKHNKRKRY